MDSDKSAQRPHHLQTEVPPLHNYFPRTANSTPISSPGLFSPSNPRPHMAFPATSASDATTPVAGIVSSPYLHPLQSHRVRETNKALVDLDLMTGRKIINQYEVIEEIGRGVHGKVKLARNLENGENVAIKIVARFSKKRRLGKVTTALGQQDKTKKEIAILKKIRHPNVVALLEIVDDPDLKKIYMVLEHVELGEIVWRKKGLPWICAYERHRIEKEMRGEINTEEEEQYFHLMDKRNALKEIKRAKMQQRQRGPEDFWSIEYGAAADDSEGGSLPRTSSHTGSAMSGIEAPRTASRDASRAASRTPSRGLSLRDFSRSATPQMSEPDASSFDAEYSSDMETPGPLHSQPGSSANLATVIMPEDAMFRGRSPSMADSIISHMSSVDFNNQSHDAFADDYSYVPCFTIEYARATFRDTVLGLEYLHYEGIVHRDIKPANLLWTKDHRVKIADFGVSYFGRPIRDGEMDEFVSESEARDFDDDLELAKTVGTPAFFAPELCYTDLDGVEQPRISEQIDVWSLGVTLYCLIFARIPFMAEDEFQMFRKIAKEDIHIPRRRLRPVDPQTHPSTTSLYKRVSNSPYRDDNELSYEEIDDLLYDLLKRMLTKNPEKRIRLREVKRHPWVVQGIADLMAWIDDTDPSRQKSGLRIQVDDREITRAVVPLTFLERARSAVKKAVGKVIPHRPADKVENQSRRRATSSAASSAGDSILTGASLPYPRDARRKSLKGDDYFAGSDHHPLSQSVTASPQGSPSGADTRDDPLHNPTSVGGGLGGRTSRSATDFNTHSDFADRAPSTASSSSYRDLMGQQTHLRTRSITNAFLALTPAILTSHTTPATPAAEDLPTEDPMASLRKSRDMKPHEDGSRSHSVDRGLFGNHDKRAEAKVSVSTAIAPGNVEVPPRRPTPLRPIDVGLNSDKNLLSSPMFFSPGAVRNYYHDALRVDPSSLHGEHPLTSQQVLAMEGKTPPPRVYKPSTPESFARAQEQMSRRQQRQLDDEKFRQEQLLASSTLVDPSDVPCPPSPDDDLAMEVPPAPSRCNTSGTVVTSSSTSLGNIATPLTSPSEITSPMSIPNLDGAKSESHTFRSDPSLPALLSGASSVSADAEGDFLLRPGSVDSPSLIETSDSLTPPALEKETITGFPLEVLQNEDSGIQLHLASAVHAPTASVVYSSRAIDDDEDDDSDSDEGLVMAKTKRKAPLKDQTSQPLSRIGTSSRRRDTQTSVGSTDTAKKVVVQSE